MANEQLESFLKGETATVTEAPPEAPQAAPEAPAPKPEAKAEPAAKPATAKPEPEDEADAEPTDRLEQDGKSYIPQQVLERERQRRQDWKARAVEAETKHKELQRQLDEATAPRHSPATAATSATTAAARSRHRSPRFAQHLVQQQQAALLNERLNNSEMMLADKIGQRS